MLLPSVDDLWDSHFRTAGKPGCRVSFRSCISGTKKRTGYVSYRNRSGIALDPTLFDSSASTITFVGSATT